MEFGWLVLLPPIFVVLWATFTQRLMSALIIGIVSAVAIFNKTDFSNILPMLANRFVMANELSKLLNPAELKEAFYPFIILFLIALSILIILIKHSGAAYAYASFISNKLKSAKNVEKSSLILSWFFFIDDYFSCLTVGSVIQPVSAWFKVPKVKSAILVVCMASPVAVLFPISSWASFVVGQLRQSGISISASPGALIIADSFYVYFKLIPFLLYSLVVVASVWFLVHKRLSFGILHKHQKEAEKNGNLFGGREQGLDKGLELNGADRLGGRLLDFVLPIATLCFSVLISILYLGSFNLFGGKNELLVAIQQANTGAALFIGSAIALIVSFVYLLIRRRVKLGEVFQICREGFDLMGSTILVLMLIWTFSSMLKNDLKTGEYLASLVVGKFNIQFMPAIFFVTAACIAMLIGSAWGTMSLLLSLAVPMLVSLSGAVAPVDISQVLILFPLLGAIIGGSIAGTHLSPLGDNVLMASKSIGAHHADVISAQRSIALPSAISTFCAFLAAGFLITSLGLLLTAVICFIIGVSMNVAFLKMLHYRSHRND